MRKLTQEQAVGDFKKKHGERYDYSRVVYVNAKVHVIIGCPKHGWFEQAPTSHRDGKGCSKCGHFVSSQKQTTHPKKLIEDFIAVHGNRYDYSRVDASSQKIVIGCKEHGWFEQDKHEHKIGSGCSKCGTLSRIAKRRCNPPKYKPRRNIAKLIDELKTVHDDRYDYSKINAETKGRKITVGCPEHGWFIQNISDHRRGSKCPECSKENGRMLRSRDQKSAIDSFKTVHGNRYDYSRVQYSSSTTKVTIGCSVHGWFEQLPSNHQKGQGCYKCGVIQRSKSKKMTLEEFISKSRTKHEDKYDYSLVDLQSNNLSDKVKIICPNHGIFLQDAQIHMLKSGCKQCANKYNGDNYKFTQEQFIEKATAKHGDTYDYSKTVYTYARKKVIVTCRTHGDFEQEAFAHTAGQGCPQCKNSQGEKLIALWLEEKSIPYKTEKTFEDCLSSKGRRMKFDFYLPNHNAIVEFDGPHHYREVEFFGGNNRLKSVQEHDEIKNQYAKKKGIPLLRIPFFFIKDVPALLTEFLGHTAVGGS